MKIRTMFGLALVGTALYAHKQHGGEFTVDSFKQSLNDLWRAIQNKADDAKSKLEDTADRVRERAKDLADKAQSKASDIASTAQEKASSTQTYGSSGYTGGYGNGTNRR